jgi:hypothetical protein
MMKFFRKLIERFKHDRAYFELYRGGLRIAPCNTGMGTKRYRFFWLRPDGSMVLIEQVADITDLGNGMWSTMLNGSSRRLDNRGFDKFTIAPSNKTANDEISMEDYLETH